MNERKGYIDSFRGFTVILMLLVNNQGDWGHVFSQLRHCAWNGLTIADTVFPFFLFLSGYSIHLSQKNRDITTKSLVIKILKRGSVLFFLGLLINFIPELDLRSVRNMGVLQRISICYVTVSIMNIYMDRKAFLVVSSAILILYSMAIKFISPYGNSISELTQLDNVARFVDSTILGNHTYKNSASPGLDPEGIITTIPAIVSTMAGYVFASYKDISGKKVFAASLAICASGMLLDFLIPVNKSLWSSSYVLLTTGISGMMLLMFVYTEKKFSQIRQTPFSITGINALAIYFTATIAGRFSSMVKFDSINGTVKSFLFDSYFSRIPGKEAASLLYSAAFTTLFFCVAYLLYRKKIIIKI